MPTVQHLNCGTMRPPATGGSLVAHVLLVETGDGLVLVDSGFGLRDIEEPARRLGPARHLIRPVLDPAETAVRQIQKLGHQPSNVRDIVLTHFDVDHAGGLADFPHARVHLTAAESQAAQHPRTANERSRYLPAQREHRPHLVEHDPERGDVWRGFAAATEILPGVVLVGLSGHTRGHAAVAVDAGDRWILHTGDAFYHRAQIGEDGHAPRLLTLMEQVVAHDRRRVKANHDNLRRLVASGAPDLTIVNAHDPELLRQARKVVG
ncbi:glyoxylase-like metal-dependent hydrolase (beta-lactamase superfamily II) [Actinoplanes lutulentus]|uniref:Glyoxylase-like metal-dependent hydrolase (Beta-lactamase superfamily II) n=1 Tax=Actinoplanes lutulentus TaxID=1287878 RepID=A0A327ZAB8_9ACTN|nr:MBL fold metallo-hydrolase [Actinoplanes lutulentus]MBB2947163.1 glyoxylase-like metal-dependent hydrolase (beta-lactamase superfamily II) [Actinoplanes lutulentus]RAK36439.1 glyoxylase-like metal-dependent hydrolase (beta-lactamase superfamily II) [Actinoplanes lutulentus]